MAFVLRWGAVQLMGLVPLFMSFSSFGEPINIPSPNTRYEQEREQAERLEQLEHAKSSVKELESLSPLPAPRGEVSTVCFDIHTIEFEGNESFTDEEILAWLSFQPSCIGLAEINEFLRVITNQYVEAGYVTSRAFLVQQDLASGTLLIVVLEGKVENVLFNGEKVDDLHMAFQGVIGEILNLRDIEQGLDQVNRLSRYNAQIKLLPGSKQGYSIVDIQTGMGKAARLGAGFNNGGQKSTGEEQLSFDLQGENLLGLLDSWTLTTTRSAEFVDSRSSKSVFFNVDIPLGYWNMSYRTSYSAYKTTFYNNSFKFDSTGRTNSHDGQIKWLFHRDSISKSAFNLGVHHRREKNYILGNLLESGSRNLSSLSLAFEFSSRVAGGFATISPKFAYGTDWFGGEEHQSANANQPTAQFSKGSLSASYSYPISNTLSLSSTLFGQWSNDTLYSNERLSIGGEYSVRGFKGKSLSGDEGYYWRNDITYRLGLWPYLGSVTANVALDTGSIAKDSSDQFERGSLLGSSIALNAQHAQFSTALTLALPIESPSRLKADDYVVYYRLSITI